MTQTLVSASRQSLVRLSPHIVVDPVVRGWYAWAFTVAPAQSALLTARTHLPILESYLEDPETHFSASQDPELCGGPFVAIQPERVAEVERLYQQTTVDSDALGEFVHGVADLTSLLAAEAKGGSLSHLYERVPQPLRGRVELTYDLNHAPRFRLFEPLLYASELYSQRKQQLILRVADGGGATRPFVLSTPRLANADDVILDVPFSDPVVDDLFRAMVTPTDEQSLREMLGLDGDDSRVHGFIVPEEPQAPSSAPPANRLSARYFGHACLLFQGGTTNVLTDPLFSPAADRPGTLTMRDLPEHLDLVLITHAHQDHCALEALLAIRHRIGTVVVPGGASGELQDPSLRLMLESCGFDRVVGLSEFETLACGGLDVIAVPLMGEHADLAISGKCAYVVRARDSSVFVGADSACLDPALYTAVRDAVGPIDTMFIGMESVGAPLVWGYGALYDSPVPHAVNQERRTSGCDARQADEIARALGCRRAYVYAMGLEPWIWHLLAPNTDPASPQRREIERFVAVSRDRGLDAHLLEGTGDVPL